MTAHTPVVLAPFDPWGSLRVMVARALLTAATKKVPVDVRLPDGRLLVPRPDANPRPVLELVRPDALLKRIAAHPKIGIGEGYMAGDWRAAEGTDLAAVLLPFAGSVKLPTKVSPARSRMVSPGKAALSAA